MLKNRFILNYFMSVALSSPGTGKQWRSEDVLENRPPNMSHLDDLMEEFLKLLLIKEEQDSYPPIVL